MTEGGATVSLVDDAATTKPRGTDAAEFSCSTTPQHTRVPLIALFANDVINRSNSDKQ